MAPSNGAKRYLPTQTKETAPPKPLFDPEPSDTEAGALQPANGSQEPEWEGFEEGRESQEHGESSEDGSSEDGSSEDGSSEDESSEDESSEAESSQVATKKKKMEKPILPKDAEEEELERIIFGDSAGFRKGIDGFSLAPGASLDDESEKEQEDGEDYGNVADQDLFFFDAGPTAQPAGSLAVAKAEESEDDDKPAWDDSDDERLVVSLASVPQLRKLRDTEEDDMVNGKEYVRRLRRQYERLYPVPEWVIHATGQAKRKRRHIEDDGSDVESASDMDVDDEDLSTLPLSILLKDADIMSRNSRNSAKKRKLEAGTVGMVRLKDVTGAGPSAVTSLSFHPTYPLLLSSGPSSTLSLHHVNPSDPHNPNPLLTSLHIKRTPLTTTAFHPSSSDSRIFLSARRRYFHVWNLATGLVEKVSRVYGHEHEQRTMEHFALSPNGKYMALRGSSKKGGAVVNVLDARTLQWVTQARIESRGGIADFAWWGNGNGLIIAGKSGEVTEWSVQHGVVGRWMDEGAVGNTTVAVGGKSGRDDWIGGDRWVAIGSSSGIVNIYDRRMWSEKDPSTTGDGDASNGGIPKAPKPIRALDNLTTPISHLAFSPDGQVLAMASRWKHAALRLVHLPSATVYRNWPKQNTALGRITSIAWGSPSEEEAKEGSIAQLAVGMETGRIRMWELRE
ncbi:WD40 repeat-like protein [Bimuria novae-zelandiae CBS 107.79]|uniref:WD40 repeat-like protein n=1 Tax=Bimuria novae-zelandiae CBS 107.79 TaxID=1447943 RepID=A0A6A5V826_9PLEO|nr:WD40 repeat-like protein [Bimuria novae-zelandiae CBS 107.79]